VGVKKAPGMGFKGERGRRAAQQPGALGRDSDDGTMAAMHAVEIADCHHGSAQCLVGRSFIANNDERLSRLRLIDHEGSQATSVPMPSLPVPAPPPMRPWEQL